MAAVVAAGYQGINLAGDPSIQGAFQGNSWLTSEGFSYADPSVDAAEAAFGRVRGWIDNGWLSAQAATWDQNVPFAEFMAGGVAFAQNGNWQASAMAADAPFDYGVVPLPLSSTGGTYLGGESESIGATSAHPDLAWDYLEATYLSAQGQLEALAAVGSIPTRSDAGEDEAITADPVLSAFATAIAEQGAPYPDPVIPAANVEKVLLAFAQNYSAALAGSLSPADAAQQMVTTIEPLLAG